MKNSLLALLLFPCVIFARPNQRNTIEEMRIALNDVRQAYSAQRMDLELMQEEMERLKKGSAKIADERIKELEKNQTKIMTDLRQLCGITNQISQSLTLLEKELEAQNQKFGELAKLKTTLNSISKAIGTQGGGNTYRVRSGDTLEKIAKQHNTSIEALKRANGLSSTKIITGQQLRIP